MSSFTRAILPACFAVAAISVTAAAPAQAQSADTTFFLTSNGIGNGGNLGGLAGSSQLFQVTIAEFPLFVFLVANGLRVSDPFRNGDGFSGCHGCCAL